MTKIIIDGSKFEEKNDLYVPFKEKYEHLYGHNLDALDEVLNYLEESVEVELLNKNQILSVLGEVYYTSFIEVLDDNKVKHN